MQAGPARGYASIVMPSRWLAAALAACLCVASAPAAEYQYEDNVRDFLASAKQLMARNELEEAALEYENVLAIDANHREAALAAFDVYLKLGAVDAAELLLARLARMGVDSAQQSALRTKLAAVKASPPPKRIRVFTDAVAPAPVAQVLAKPAAKSADPLDDGLGDLDAPAPKPAGSAAPGPAPRPAGPAPAPRPAGAKDDLDDISL